MLKQEYSKGNKLVWTGFLLGILFKVLPVFSTPETFPALASFTAIFNILAIVFLIVLVYGLVLVLKSRGRHWTWVLLLLPLNAIGIVVIYMLKDKLPQETPAPTYNQN